MTRHQRNCTAGTVYSYHERQRDAAASGYGTKAMRLSKDSVKDFDCCCLTLQPCRNPVTTTGGYLYDKEAVLEYVLRRKQEIEKQLKQYKKQLKQAESKQNQSEKSKHQEKVETFVATESSIRSKPLNPFTDVSTSRKRKLDETNGTSSASVTSSSSSSSSAANQPGTSNGNQAGPSTSKEELPSFWIPSLTPQAKPTLVKKPDKTVYCPMSNKPLKIKDLIQVNFTIAEDKDDKRPLVAREVRYKCAVTGDMLSNSTPVAVLKPSGKVVTMECVEKLIKKDMMDPFSDTKLEESDIIPLQRGGTGFASAGGDKLAAKKARPVMMAS
ncbi:nitric oxide synthase-interacting protein-like isoform X2 [Amphiura filiformis]|uniref:nitric oxide synthase-interacting protein-like isoform X1 n=1 Tax=Amphiura filiformis TaxID=82378 RepID=UPI003B225BD3